MRISDRSSDVCSSDLAALVAAPFSFARPGICSYYVPTNESGEWNMIGYVTLGTDDLARAAAFYDAIAAELETPRMMERSEEHTSELQSLMRTSYAVFCLKKKNKIHYNNSHSQQDKMKY